MPNEPYREPRLRARLVMELRDDVHSEHFPAPPERIERAVERFVEMGNQLRDQLFHVCWEDSGTDEMRGPLFRSDDPEVFLGVIPYNIYVERVDAALCIE